MDAQVGFHGKIPGRGDFVQRGLPANFVQHWDGWLQASMMHSKEILGDGWLDAYLTSPIWRFVLSAGVIDDLMWIGAIMPSVDRVNRYFPLTIAGSMTPTISAFSAIDICDDWYTKAEDLLIQALEDDHIDLDEYSALVCGHKLPIPAITSTHTSTHFASGLINFPMTQSESVRANCSAVFDGLAQNHLGDFSLWVTSGSDNVASQGLLYSGLPPAELFTSFLRDL